MKKDIEYVRNRLFEWADFYSRSGSNLGYPKINSIARLWRDGGIFSPSYNNHGRPLPSNAKAEKMEELWKKLMEKNQDIGQTIFAKYFSPSYRASKQIAKRLGISVWAYYKRIEVGENWFLDELTNDY